MRWLRVVLAGLIILSISSIFAIQVTYALDVGRRIAAAINAPCPNLHAAALIQRQLFGHPVPRGVSGWIAVTFNVLCIWLITHRAAARVGLESMFSLRRICRWTATLGIGAFLGLLISESGYYLRPQTESTFDLLTAALLYCELPVTIFLYLYLRSLAGQIGCAGARGTLGIAVIGLPVVLIAGAIIAAAGTDFDTLPSQRRIPIFGLNGITQVFFGLVATAGVLQLIMHLAPTTLPSFGPTSAALGRLGGLIKTMMSACTRQPHRARWIVGIALWLLMVPWGIDSAASVASRSGLGSDWPDLNFTGPRVFVTGIFYYGYYGYLAAWGVPWIAFAGLLATWWMTTAPPGPLPRLAGAARAGARCMSIAPFGIELTVTHLAPIVATGSAQSESIFLMILFAEVPATFFTYVWLTQLARLEGSAQIDRKLRWMVPVVLVLQLFPTAAFFLSAPLPEWRLAPAVRIVAGAHLIQSLLVTMKVSGHLIGLCLDLGRKMRIEMLLDRLSPTRAVEKPFGLRPPTSETESNNLTDLQSPLAPQLPARSTT